MFFEESLLFRELINNDISFPCEPVMSPSNVNYVAVRYVSSLGCAGTGKTHTMLGSQEEPGIMVHTLNSLFKRMDQTKEEVDYQVSMGYLEVGVCIAALNS